MEKQNVIIGTGGRSKGKTFQQILESEEYKEYLKKIEACGIAAEEFANTLKEMYKQFDSSKTSAELMNLAGLLSLGAKVEKAPDRVSKNHPNPVYRQYKKH